MSEESFGWSDELITGNTIIDTQHRFLFSMLERMESVIEVSDIEPLLAELVHYTETHFKEEEQLMQKFAYPEFINHRELHQKLLAELATLKPHTSDRKLSAWVRLHRLIKKWLNEHIREQDFKFIRYVKETNV